MSFTQSLTDPFSFLLFPDRLAFLVLYSYHKTERQAVVDAFDAFVKNVSGSIDCATVFFKITYNLGEEEVSFLNTLIKRILFILEELGPHREREREFGGTETIETTKHYAGSA